MKGMQYCGQCALYQAKENKRCEGTCPYKGDVKWRDPLCDRYVVREQTEERFVERHLTEDLASLYRGREGIEKTLKQECKREVREDEECSF